MCTEAFFFFKSMATLRSLSDNPNISFHVGLASLIVFFHPVWDFSGSWYGKRCLLETWTFLHYIMRPWTLFKPSTLIGFLWHGSDGEEGCCLFTARLQQTCRFLTQSLRTPWGGGLAIAGRGGSPDFPLDLLWHHFREEWKDASLLSGADQSPESPCGLYSCRKGGGRTHYCLVGRWVSALCLSFFDTILTGLLGCLITTSQEWMSRLPTWPSLAWMGMGPQIF